MNKENLDSIVQKEAAEFISNLADAGLSKNDVELHVVYGGYSITVREFEDSDNTKVKAEEWGDAGISIEDMVRAHVNVNELTSREAFNRAKKVKRFNDRIQQILMKSRCIA